MLGVVDQAEGGANIIVFKRLCFGCPHRNTKLDNLPILEPGFEKSL